MLRVGPKLVRLGLENVECTHIRINVVSAVN